MDSKNCAGANIFIMIIYRKIPVNGKKCELFANTITALLEKEIKVSGIVSSNFDYWQDAGFREICRDGRSNFYCITARK